MVQELAAIWLLPQEVRQVLLWEALSVPGLERSLEDCLVSLPELRQEQWLVILSVNSLMITSCDFIAVQFAIINGGLHNGNKMS